MDPFTQRMLERAKLRREKLDSQKMELEKGIASQEVQVVNIKRKPLQNFSDNEIKCENTNLKKKEYITSERKSKLQKLAKLYSDNDENALLEEDYEDDDYDNNQENAKEDVVGNETEKKQHCKLGRLNELATRIKEWEDDLDHPKQPRTVIMSAKQDNKKESKVDNKNSKRSNWDPSLVEKLCSQGFSLSVNESRLIYDFDKSKEEEGEGKKSVNSKIPETESKATHKPTTVAPTKITKPSQNQSTSGNQSEVLKKAALFESSKKEESASKKAKDPAELSIAERKALFERNKGDAVLPKNCFVSSAVSSDKKWGGEAKSHKPVICGFERKENKINEKLESDSGETKPLRYFGDEEIEQRINRKRLSPGTIPVEPKSRKSLEDGKIEQKDFFEKNLSLKENSPASPAKVEIPVGNSPVPKPPPLPSQAKTESETSSDKEEKKNDLLSPKPGRLYPSLSNLDISNESEIISEGDSANQSQDSNVCLNMTLSDLLEMNKNNPLTPDQSFSKSKECQVLNKMDKLLEDALNDISSDDDSDHDMIPSPPKMMKSSSFEYKTNSDDNNPLLHTVSFYRKQQKTTCLSPNSTGPFSEEEEVTPEKHEDEALLVQNKIQLLVTEVNKQQTIISQATQALNLCLSTVEFSGSGEQVEGERLLLLATHKRQACLNEIQRLKVENSLRPQGSNDYLTERGDLTLTNICLKLKRDALRAIAAAENLVYFVCLIKSDEQVLATPVVSASKENLKDLVLQFPGQVKLEGLLSNFKITVEVYNLELNKELLPHEVKYHIGNKKEKKLLTPIKSKKSESKLIKPYVQSPAGPNAVRTSNFQMCGYIVFSLREVTRTQWILNKVPYISPLEGTILMTIQSQLRLDHEFRGFLTMFDDISGFGAWHRRWCLLSSHFISYWKYPDDEQKKVPNGTIDLRSVITENVGLVSRDVCARLNTFLLETTRPRLNEDKDSLVLSVNENVTTIRHLLSADSKQEMMTWCKKINTTLALLRSWKCNVND